MKSKELITLLVVALNFKMAWAVESNEALPGKAAKYYYFELRPEEKVVFTFIAPKKCKNESNDIMIEDLEVVKFYRSEELDKRVPIRVKSLYVQSSSECSTPSKLMTTKKLVVGPFSKRLTHVRLTVEEGISVQKGLGCGEEPEGKFYNEFCSLIPK